MDRLSLLDKTPSSGRETPDKDADSVPCTFLVFGVMRIHGSHSVIVNRLSGLVVEASAG